MLLQFPRVVLLGTVILTVGGTASAQDGARDHLMEDLRRTMAALATTRAAADGNAWSRYVSDEFVVIHPDGRIHNRVEEIAELNAAQPTPVPVRKAERFHWHGDHMVVYASDFVSSRGQPVRAIEVWIHESSGWKIAAAQVTRIEG
jgi:uncharacterized protein DUF4440